MIRTLDIPKVEKELGIKLPSFFTNFHLQNTQLIEELRNVSNDADYIIISSDADWMVEHNRHLLKSSPEGLFSNKICVEEDGCGNYSFISIFGDDKRVFFIDHEIADEFIDKEDNAINWESDTLTKFENLVEYVKYNIEAYKSFN